jgi:hypothetical protein
MSYEKQLNINKEQLNELIKQGIDIDALAGAGFVFNSECGCGSLDAQIDAFAESHQDEHDDITFAAETGDSFGAEMEAIESERMDLNYYVD